MKAIIKNYDIKGSITLPASKSILHRLIISAALATGKSKIHNLNLCDDVIATIDCVKALGAKVMIDNNDIYIEGINNDLSKVQKNIINIKDCATTLRFMIPIFALSHNSNTLIGSSSLLKRPLDIFKELFIQDNNKIIINQCLQSKTYYIPGNVSSQFISGLLFALPLLEKDSMIKINGELESKPYVDMTIAILRMYGIIIKEESDGYYIPALQKYHCADYVVEGDYSQLAFYLALGTFYPLTINNIQTNSIQGDRVVIDILKRMNACIAIQNNQLKTQPSLLQPVVVDLQNCPDLGPVLIALSCFINGSSTFINIQRLRFKESNRIQAMVTELKKFNIKTYESEKKLIIEGGNILYTGEALQCHNDHRICMALVLMSVLLPNEIIINDVECINKSYPNFFDDLKLLTCSIELQ